jgi:hypothetical protein
MCNRDSPKTKDRMTVDSFEFVTTDSYIESLLCVTYGKGEKRRQGPWIAEDSIIGLGSCLSNTTNVNYVRQFLSVP